jgi:stearoyl-CoA desaturase (delta-9 desaturase)
MGASAWQGSIRWWVLKHRVHHRWTDTKYDPYNATRGFFYSHLGWLLEKPAFNPKMALVSMRDLDSNWVVRYQRTLYPSIVIFFAIVFPTFIGYQYADVLGGFLWVGCFARFISWHAIFFVNSYCHYAGERPYDESISATTNFFLGFWSMGESNHSGHHVFAKVR